MLNYDWEPGRLRPQAVTSSTRLSFAALGGAGILGRKLADRRPVELLATVGQ
jgi:hypothetical protein